MGLPWALRRCNGREEERVSSLARPSPRCQGTCKLGTQCQGALNATRGLRTRRPLGDRFVRVTVQHWPDEPSRKTLQLQHSFLYHVAKKAHREAGEGFEAKSRQDKHQEGAVVINAGNRPQTTDHLHARDARSRKQKRSHSGQELPSGTFQTALLSKRSITEIKGSVKPGGGKPRFSDRCLGHRGTPASEC